jgi:glutathionylspermidine synthase
VTAEGPLDRDAAIFAYDQFARRIVDGKILTDPWIEGRARFRQTPVFVTPSTQRLMYRASEEVAAVYNELCLIVKDHPELLDDFFGLTPIQKAMWLASTPLWHGLARADVFMTDDGLAFAELNCDTPTGEAEAVILNALTTQDHDGAVDPNIDLEARFVGMVEALAARELEGDRPRTVGIVYPTEITDDLGIVRLYRRWFETRGYGVVLGSPYNLSRDERGLCLFDTPFSIMLRHYKTDWWGERIAVWDDSEIPDKEPLAEPLQAALESAVAGECAVVNPFGAVLPQNKRAMAFMWEHIHRFSPHSADVIQRHIPVTSRLETLHHEQLLAQREEWVLKSDYGAEGDEVIVGRAVADDIWRSSLAHARKGRWIAQRYFAAHTNEVGESVNYGVYLVAGEAAGIYARVQDAPTDDQAVSAPALVRDSSSRSRATKDGSKTPSTRTE